MKRSINKLIGYGIQTNDGVQGMVNDFLFDEEKWIIRYMEVSEGLIISGKRVVIPNMLLGNPDWESRLFPVNLSKSEIENCPLLENNLPISRKYEEELNEYYSTGYYWPQSITPSSDAPAMAYPLSPKSVPPKIIDEHDLDTKLRSFKEIRGYGVHATDGRLGFIADLIFDDSDWKIVYAIINIGQSPLWNKEVILAIEWLEEISYVKKEIKVNLMSENIKNAPKYDASQAINEEYEKQLYDYYGRRVEQL